MRDASCPPLVRADGPFKDSGAGLSVTALRALPLVAVPRAAWGFRPYL